MSGTMLTFVWMINFVVESDNTFDKPLKAIEDTLGSLRSSC